MNDFEALANSLLQQVVSYVGKGHLVGVHVEVDEYLASAQVTLELREDTWEEQSRAIDKMIEVRELFLDELALEYRFVRAEASKPRNQQPAFSSAVV